MIIEESRIFHQGEIRNKLTDRGYYVTPLGSILEDKGAEYILGHIKDFYGLIFKRKLVVIQNVGTVINGNYYPKIRKEKLNLLTVLMEERIPHELRNWNKSID